MSIFTLLVAIKDTRTLVQLYLKWALYILYTHFLGDAILVNLKHAVEVTALWSSSNMLWRSLPFGHPQTCCGGQLPLSAFNFMTAKRFGQA
jgi:hypothetical protein